MLIPSYTPFSDTSISSIHWLNRYSLCLNTQMDWLHKICIHMLPPKKSIVHHFSIFHWHKLAISSGFSLGKFHHFGELIGDRLFVRREFLQVRHAAIQELQLLRDVHGVAVRLSGCGTCEICKACVNSCMICLMLILW